MRTVTLGVSSREEMSARFVAAFKGNAQGAHISFASHELLFQTLTPAALEPYPCRHRRGTAINP
ncbi:hypothetical protein PTKU64_80810 [Paraburkholderia terrae]|uniref:Uncharacterized protein n=1 Tax=Paraburkholderia terrae TaxID=311230 RepID=A0ABM7TZ86_9BURK|nr:hypothetical protein PTKU64_80810 [Paraburkholderia terrae]